MGALKEAHGGELIDRYLSPEAAEAEKESSRDIPSWDMTMRQLCDIELILNGAFSPLTGFLNQDDYEGVRDNMRLGSGIFWPMPVTLDVSEEFAESVKTGAKIALRAPTAIGVSPARRRCHCSSRSPGLRPLCSTARRSPKRARRRATS